MARKKGKVTSPVKQQPPTLLDPILVRCVLRIPSRNANALLPTLGVALDCGGAVLRRRGNVVELEAPLEIRKVGDIVAKGVPVLVLERIPVAPVPRSELIADADAWFKHIRRLR